MSVSIKMVDLKACATAPPAKLVARLSAARPSSAPVAERLLTSEKKRSAILEARASKASQSTARGKVVLEANLRKLAENESKMQRRMEASTEKRNRVLKQAQFRALDAMARVKAAVHKKDALNEQRVHALQERLETRMHAAEGRRSTLLEKRTQHARQDVIRHQEVLERINENSTAQLASPSKLFLTQPEPTHAHDDLTPPGSPSSRASRSYRAVQAFEKARLHNEHAAEVKRNHEAKLMSLTSPAKLEARMASATVKREAALGAIVGKAQQAGQTRETKLKTLKEHAEAMACAVGSALAERLADAAYRRVVRHGKGSASHGPPGLLMGGCSV